MLLSLNSHKYRMKHPGAAYITGIEKNLIFMFHASKTVIRDNRDAGAQFWFRFRV